MGKNAPRNVLAERYASDEMVAIWSPAHKIVLERKLWIAAMHTFRSLELERDIPLDAIKAYEATINDVNLESIAHREARLRHDVKAHIEEFNSLASQHIGRSVQYIHEGFTSRDPTDNTEQLQIFRSIQLVRDRTVALLSRLGSSMAQYETTDICGRSHLVPAQTTTLGKRFANIAEELLTGFERLEHLIGVYAMRGIKGPMGTQQDILSILKTPEKIRCFEFEMRKRLGFPRTLESTGQVYPRSLDFEVVSRLCQLGSPLGNMATMVRLMAGLDLMHEGFGEEQTGSSAMPHKVNSRTCERVCSLLDVLCGYQDMVSRLLGHQWLEGDVSCSVIRRVALPDSFFAIDGMIESAMTVLGEMEIFPGAIQAELERYLPFLSTTALLMYAVQKGMGREDAHAVIKKAALEALEHMREGGSNLFLSYLSDNEFFPWSETQRIASEANHGLAVEQTKAVLIRIQEIIKKYPDAAKYAPAPIL